VERKELDSQYYSLLKCRRPGSDSSAQPQHVLVKRVCVSFKDHLWLNFTEPRSIRPIENAFKHFLVYKLPWSGTWSGTKRVKLSHRGKEINCHLSQNSNHLKRKRRDARTLTYLDYLHIFLHNEGDQCVSRKDSGISNQERAFIAG